MRITTPTRALGIALALGLSLALSACGGSSGTTAKSDINCTTGAIKASGSTAQKNAMADWINAYQSACPDATIDYQAIGSSAGITDFKNNQTAFAGSDSALKPEDAPGADARCKTGKAINIPMVGGAITLAFNVSGVDSLTLTPAVIAGIFNGSITKWDDTKIKALNSGVSLPSASISAFHRSDGSGTTDNFTKYLAATAPAQWTYGNAKEWKAPGGLGAKGNDGVAAAIKSTDNAIGYIELSFAQDAALKVASVDNGAGAVEPTSQNAAAAITKATRAGTGNDLKLNLDYTIKEANTYPIVLVTYEITCQKGLPSKDLALTKSFLTYTASDAAQNGLTDSGYVPITGDLLTDVRSAVASLA
ncbi:MAG TPA: phosphate ABC transporter substrate-binding protein PstS [Actinobacteria bacterium]|nr:phosphate ABC transporter substrate-binding protein PstS [Actinomycetota bacterium]HCK79555.1 phosphate ABC transporter substrate-binding protein PstS [Actinomycetota bacterium]